MIKENSTKFLLKYGTVEHHVNMAKSGDTIVRYTMARHAMTNTEALIELSIGSLCVTDSKINHSFFYGDAGEIHDDE